MPDVTIEPKSAYLDEKGNRSIRSKDGKTVYRGYTIEEKRDFGRHGFLIKGHKVSHGYVVTDGGLTNVMPGATWFLTVSDALRAIDDLIDSLRGLVQSDREFPFWAFNRFRRNAEERAPELAMLLQELYDQTEFTFDAKLAERIKALLDAIDANCDTRDTVREVGGEARKVGPRMTGRFGGMFPL